jgi:hypothetical protein
MDKFLDRCDQRKLNQEDINHLNRAITSNEIEPAIVSQKRKFYQTFKEELIPTPFKLCHEAEREGTWPQSFYEAWQQWFKPIILALQEAEIRRIEV